MKRLTVVAVAIPLLGMVALMARAEFAVRSGPTWQIPIAGYDPRDLLHGRYLQYRYELNWQDVDSCGAAAGDPPGGTRALDEQCCLCLTRDPSNGVDPPVRQIGCEQVHVCDGWLLSSALSGPQRYFVPEDRATDLEGALRDRPASLELACGPSGEPAIRELLLDGRPWREQLGE